MRAVEGAGAYRIGRPLGRNNGAERVWLQKNSDFLSVLLPTPHRAQPPPQVLPRKGKKKSFYNGLMTEAAVVGWELQPAVHRSFPSDRRRPAPKRARKGAHNQQDHENYKENFGDSGRQACQAEKSQISGDQGQNQKRERPTEHR